MNESIKRAKFIISVFVFLVIAFGAVAFIVSLKYSPSRPEPPAEIISTNPPQENIPVKPALEVTSTSNPKAEEFAGAVTSLFYHLEIGKPLSHENLTIYPVLWKGKSDQTIYATLDTAIKNKTFVISEKNGGNVPSLKAGNSTAEPLYIMAGEVIVGAKQDRVVAHDMLIVPGQKELSLPVYCVESNRWTHVSENFDSAGFAATSKVRGEAVKKKSQAKIWEEVGVANSASGKERGGSLKQSFNDEKTIQARSAYRKALINISDGKKIVGVVCAINGEFVNADVFRSPALFASMWPKLMEAYALDALQNKKEEQPARPTGKQAHSFLSSIFEADYREFNNPGAGAEFSIQSDGRAGSVLVHDRKVIHLALFPEKEPVNKLPASSESISDFDGSDPQMQRLNNLGYVGGGDARPGAYKDKGMEFQLHLH